jgi:hypothetical protein
LTSDILASPKAPRRRLKRMRFNVTGTDAHSEVRKPHPVSQL